MAERITIADYDPRWPLLFESEKLRLQHALGSLVVDIQHIGSTAVPRLAAKPVIDIMAGVESLAAADEVCILPIVGLGYEYVKDFEKELPFRRYFRRDCPEGIRAHHIHIVEVRTYWWRRYLAFRDCLRADAEARRSYENLKRELAQHEWGSGLEYAHAKTAFIEGLLAKALNSGKLQTF